MVTSNTELIFPPKLIPSLRDFRDTSWAQLVDRIGGLERSHPERLAFELLIVRWCGCINCQADSFRAMQGCFLCASQAVRRYRGTSSDLKELFEETVREIKAYQSQ